MNPAVIGSTNRQTATQLAEAAIDRMGRARKYGVGMDELLGGDNNWRLR